MHPVQGVVVPLNRAALQVATLQAATQ
jgi:hypothetical protein